jgi:hypothetical protein
VKERERERQVVAGTKSWEEELGKRAAYKKRASNKG